jgi:hypothetical protein
VGVAVFRLSSFAVVGFSGARRGVPADPVRLALSRVAPSAAVFVGCASGVDSLVRACWRGSLRVFSARALGCSVSARSVVFVRALAAAGGCLVVFPGRPCPRGLRPSSVPGRCFCGFGSGSWASAALAAGLGCPVLLFWPGSRPASRCWRLRSLGSGWWLRLPG